MYTENGLKTMENLITKIEEVPKGKKLIVFDLDGTLTDSKMVVDVEMGNLLGKLLKVKKVGVVGGGAIDRFKTQILDSIQDVPLENMFLLPLNGGAFYQYKNGSWGRLYSEELSDEEKKKIQEAFKLALEETNYPRPERLYGEQMDDRGGQVTFSALGQNAPLEEKAEWLRRYESIHLQLALKVQEYLPDMEAKTAGLTSIDVTRKGIDKKFAIQKLMQHVGISPIDTLFVGDAFGPDGNDTPALGAGVQCFKVTSPADTKKLISFLLRQ